MLRGVNLDSRSLRFALRDGAKSLGQLRRDRDWPPEKVLQLALTHPDQFRMTEVAEGRRQHPAIEFGSELADDAKAFVAMVRGGGKGGVTNVKVHKILKIKTERSVQLAADFPDLISTRQVKLKTYFYWRPSLKTAKRTVNAEPETADTAAGSPPETFSAESPVRTAEPASEPVLEAPRDFSELEKDRDRLLGLVKDGARSDQWLSEFGYDRESLVAIVKRWPELFQAEVVQLSRDPSGAFLNVGIKRPPMPAEETVSQPVEPMVSLQPSLSELVPAEQLREMRFKPASPDMARSRNDPRYARGGIQRRRNPLVEI